LAKRDADLKMQTLGDLPRIAPQAVKRLAYAQACIEGRMVGGFCCNFVSGNISMLDCSIVGKVPKGKRAVNSVPCAAVDVTEICPS
jgi:hypothetical protein